MRLVFLALAAASLLAQPQDPGPKVGSVIPKFRLKDQQGIERDLASLTGPKGLVLVFTRSADW
jgi:hypothetical protein